jgi:hypothetical protein
MMDFLLKVKEMLESSYNPNEDELARLCRIALEKSYGSKIPMPNCTMKKPLAKNPFNKIETYWKTVT